MKQAESLKRIDMPNENKINDYADCENQMYSLKTNLRYCGILLSRNIQVPNGVIQKKKYRL